MVLPEEDRVQIAASIDAAIRDVVVAELSAAATTCERVAEENPASPSAAGLRLAASMLRRRVDALALTVGPTNG